MAKRFTSTEIWNEDWFLDMPSEYKLFWYYMLSQCDHAGFFKVNIKTFCGLNSIKVDSEIAISFFNTGKDRVRVISKSVWLIEDFFVFQYGSIFNFNNKMHESIGKLYNKHNINIKEVRGLREVKNGSERGVGEGNDTLKEKDKEKEYLFKHKKSENGKFSGNFKAQGEELFAQRDARHIKPD